MDEPRANRGDFAWTAASVEAELIQAASTMHALRVSGLRPAGPRSSMPEVLRDFNESYGWSGARCRPACPTPAEIAAMDRAFAWLSLIPPDKRVLRRIVSARMMTHPDTGRHVYSWRRIGHLIGASHMAVSRWHAQGIAIIVLALTRTG